MDRGIEPDVNRTRNLLIWSQTRYHCATDPGCCNGSKYFSYIIQKASSAVKIECARSIYEIYLISQSQILKLHTILRLGPALHAQNHRSHP